MKRDWKSWARAAGIRAVKTVAETALGIITGSAVMTLGSIDWGLVGSASLVAGIVSLGLSVKGLPEEKAAE
jgi:hypothetical protein